MNFLFYSFLSLQLFLKRTRDFFHKILRIHTHLTEPALPLERYSTAKCNSRLKFIQLVSLLWPQPNPSPCIPSLTVIHVSLTSETQCEWLREKFCDGYAIVYKALAATQKNFFFIKKESKSAATSRVQNFGSIALSCQGSSISSRSRVLISKETALFGINLSHRSSVPKWSDKPVF
jgi:hypothetical protein